MMISPTWSLEDGLAAPVGGDGDDLRRHAVPPEPARQRGDPERREGGGPDAPDDGVAADGAVGVGADGEEAAAVGDREDLVERGDHAHVAAPHPALLCLSERHQLAVPDDVDRVGAEELERREPAGSDAAPISFSDMSMKPTVTFRARSIASASCSVGSTSTLSSPVAPCAAFQIASRPRPPSGRARRPAARGRWRPPRRSAAPGRPRPPR